MSVLRPLPGEYPAYFQKYLDLVPEGDFNELFPASTAQLVAAFRKVPQDKESFAYAEGKWNIKELLQHLSDTDRVFSYRALVAARGDETTVLYSMDENKYAAGANVKNRTLGDLLEEFIAIRTSFFKLLQFLEEEQSAKPVLVQGNSVTARALGFIAIGHVLHHLSVLRERYSMALAV